MSKELKNCPFCGGEADLIEQKHREYPSTYYVRCKSCHCKSLERIGTGIVIEAWNTRKPIDNIVEQLDEANEGVCPYCGCDLNSEDVMKIVEAGGK